jgi:hypothetical protein
MDTFWGAVLMSRDQDLLDRCRVAAARTGVGSVDAWVTSMTWVLVSQPGWAAAWESALASGNPAPGSDPAVVTDGMITAAVESLVVRK